jgi:hypothetical protein
MEKGSCSYIEKLMWGLPLPHSFQEKSVNEDDAPVHRFIPGGVVTKYLPL